MRVIPVLDLKDGVVVHGVKGERERYQPVVSVLTDVAAPLAVAQAFSDKLSLHEFYIADLDAIQRRGHHQTIIARLAQSWTLMVDAGVSDVQGVLKLLAIGASQAIIGAETLSGWDALEAIFAEVPAHQLVFSLDMHAGQVISRSLQLANLNPLKVLERLQHMGWKQVILLDLARVGAGTGVDRTLIAEARRRYSELTLLVGGGVRDMADLRDLESLGVSGVLVATALHQGNITANDLALYAASSRL
jgi:phosphoribosylformimino-5-aminoimidazole carboxamide ribotide isomerase